MNKDRESDYGLNGNAKKLTDEVNNALNNGFWSKAYNVVTASASELNDMVFGKKATGDIVKEEETKIESYNKIYKDAKVLVMQDKKGAIIIDDKGNSEIIGSNYACKKEASQSINTSHNFMKQMAIEAIQSGGIIDAKEKEQLLKWDEVMNDVVLTISKNNQSVTIADRNGKVSKVDQNIADEAGKPWWKRKSAKGIE